MCVPGCFLMKSLHSSLTQPKSHFIYFLQALVFRIHALTLLFFFFFCRLACSISCKLCAMTQFSSQETRLGCVRKSSANIHRSFICRKDSVLEPVIYWICRLGSAEWLRQILEIKVVFPGRCSLSHWNVWTSSKDSIFFLWQNHGKFFGK